MQSTNIHGTEQDRHIVIEWDQEEKKLIRRECMQCSVKRHALPCHDITAFSDPAHAHEIITKSLKVVEKVTDPSSGSVKRFEYTRLVSGFRLIQGIKRRDPAKTPPLPKDSLIICDWTNDYLHDSMLKRSLRISNPKMLTRMEFMLSIRWMGGSCGWRVNCAYQTPWPPEC